MLLKLILTQTIQEATENETPITKTLMGDSKARIFGWLAASLLPLNKKINK